MGDTDFRAMVEGAYAEAETGATDGGGASGAAPDAGVEPGGAGVLDEQPGQAAAGQGQDQGDDGSAVAAAQRARDAAGRFAPKGKDAPQAKATKPVTPKPGGEASAPASTGGDTPLATDAASIAPPPAHKPPQSWTPAEREHFAKAPPEVQAAIARREREAAMAVQEAAPAKRFHQEVSQAFRPYEQFAQSIGQTPLGLAQQASQVAMQISTAPPHIAAQVLANLIRSRRDISLDLINNHLADQPEQPGQPAHIDPIAIAQQAEQRVWSRLQGERQQKMQARFEQEVSAFASDPANEFFSHEEHGPAIQSRVLGLIQATSHLPPDKQPPLSDLYGEAVWAHPATRAIMQKRADAERAKASVASTQQARTAASSVKSTPSTGASAVQTPKTHREMVAAVYDSLEGSR